MLKLAILMLAAASVAAGDQTAGAPIAAKLQWRSVGPFIGGRVVAVAGVPRQNLFYMGAVDGGIWKSTDYGIKWVNISDGTLPGESTSIGAIAVAPSNPSVIWAGTGESDIRGDMITGDGVFKSTDAGKSWSYAGLRDTHTTSAIAIDPHNPNVVYVASMGHAFASNASAAFSRPSTAARRGPRCSSSTAKPARSRCRWIPKTRQRSTRRCGKRSASRGGWSAAARAAACTRRPTAARTGRIFRTIPAIRRAFWGASASPSPRRTRASSTRSCKPRRAASSVPTTRGATWRRTNDDMELRQRAFYYMSVYVDPTNPNVIYVPNVQAAVGLARRRQNVSRAASAARRQPHRLDRSA